MEKNPVAIVSEIDSKLCEISQIVRLDNENKNELVDAFNKGVNALLKSFHTFLNSYGLALAFEKKEE